MTKTHLLLASLPVLLCSCSTMNGLKQDLASGYDAVAGTFAKPVDPVEEAKKQLPVHEGACPAATVRPDLQRLVEFKDPAAPSEQTRVSEVEIISIYNTCRNQDGDILMQIDLAIAGETGPKARAKPTDKPSFAYPYFVAVTDEQGNVVSKEIFAASLAFAANQQQARQSETIFQSMPAPDASAGQTYAVIVGFQLTPEQHAYNQSHPKAMAQMPSGGDADAPFDADAPPVPRAPLPPKKPEKGAGNS